YLPNHYYYNTYFNSHLETGRQIYNDMEKRSRECLHEFILQNGHIDGSALKEHWFNIVKADVFLSHCGMNSVSESLYFGVPLVMLPQTAEQKGVAARVRELGAGVMLDQTDADSIRHAIDTLLSDNAYRKNAAQISHGFKTCTGAKGAAQKILQVCKNAV
ncbi:MAG: hypothetical protein IJD86_02600, partial [Clostridia bacterium]|nr:hypothetical protein [Clostridia bacterium]